MGASGFRHIGRVVALEGGVVSVALDKLAACEGCRAKGKCSVSGGGEGSTSVMRVASSEAFAVGELVSVSITYRVGWTAVLFAYLIPLVLFLVSIVALITAGVGEGVAAGVTFGVVAIYYFGVYLLRERFERVVEFGVSRVYAEM